VRYFKQEVQILPPKTNRSPEPSERLEHRLHLNNETRTEWFDRGELTFMVKKYEGRIITIESRNRLD